MVNGERIYEHGSGGEITMVTMGLFIYDPTYPRRDVRYTVLM